MIEEGTNPLALAVSLLSLADSDLHPENSRWIYDVDRFSTASSPGA
jgi:hypothetical protein